MLDECVVCLQNLSTSELGSTFETTKFRGGSQNLERQNIERRVFRKFETSNIEITKVELFDYLYFFKLQYFEKLLLFEIE